jgi:chorismate dehydratase
MSATSPLSPLRVGTPSFLVARPLDLGLEDEPGFDVRYDYPSVLIDELRQGALDVALVSTIELFRRPGYRYLSGPAVTGRGHVASVQVFLRKPLDEVETVALDPASRAARALTRVVLPTRTEKLPSFLDVPLGQDAAAADADAWLRIGDQALREFLDENALPAFNPSEAWFEDTGLPFVFAVWIVAPGVELTPGQLEAFAAAQARGAAHIEELAEEASRKWALPLESCRTYLGEECVYDPGDDLDPALITFRDAAAPLALCLPDLRPEPISVPSAECPG